MHYLNKHHNDIMISLRLYKIIGVLAGIGLLVSVYSLLHNQGFSSGAFCTIGDKLNCDIVNKGPFSTIAGIPVSFIGVVGYLFLLICSWMLVKKPSDRGLQWFLVLASVGGLVFSLYLTGIEAFILDTWCLLCLTSQALILSIAILCGFLFMAPQTK